jgi:hypothetical protein
VINKNKNNQKNLVADVDCYATFGCCLQLILVIKNVVLSRHLICLDILLLSRQHIWSTDIQFNTTTIFFPPRNLCPAIQISKAAIQGFFRI